MIGFGGTDVGVEGEGVLPAGRIGLLCAMQGLAEKEQCGDLAELVAATAVQVQCLLQETDGPLVVALPHADFG